MLLAATGALKAARNAGVYVPAGWLLYADFTHLSAAMAFMFPGLGSLIKGRKIPAQEGA